MYQKAPALVERFIAKCSGVEKSVCLTNQEASVLQRALEEDALGAMHSAWASFADAILGVSKKNYGWATAKLYFACFYLCKAKTSKAGILVFYVGNKPRSISAVPGSMIKKEAGNSHSIVQDKYKNLFPGDVLSDQEIEGKSPIDWMADKREMVNYRLMRWIDPKPFDWFVSVDSHGIRRCLSDYLSDLNLYAYDKDHAALALPLLGLIESKKTFSSLFGSNDAEREHIVACLRDKDGPLNALVNLVE